MMMINGLSNGRYMILSEQGEPMVVSHCLTSDKDDLRFNVGTEQILFTPDIEPSISRLQGSERNHSLTSDTTDHKINYIFSSHRISVENISRGRVTILCPRLITIFCLERVP